MTAEQIEEPGHHQPDGARRWAAYLGWLRAEAIDGVLSLSEQEQRHTRLSSGWTPLELLNHLLHMEQRWFVWGFLGEQVEEPWGDWAHPEPWQADQTQARWQVPAGVSAAELADWLRTLGDRIEQVLAEQPLSARAAVGGRFGEDPPTLEWICFHVLAEYARHVGHLDIVVELSRAAGPAEDGVPPSPDR